MHIYLLSEKKLSQITRISIGFSSRCKKRIKCQQGPFDNLLTIAQISVQVNSAMVKGSSALTIPRRKALISFPNLLVLNSATL